MIILIDDDHIGRKRLVIFDAWLSHKKDKIKFCENSYGQNVSLLSQNLVEKSQ